uniref:LAGLI-DADG endonuclease n=1 Tax=Metarhizium pingshaense TaxID=1278899 RepID=UPI0023D86A59
PYTNNYNLNIARAIPTDCINNTLIQYKSNNDTTIFSKEEDLGYYLAGLLEGDGHISLPSLGNTTLNRVLNPRIVFTSHKDNLGMYAFLQSELGNIGRFQSLGDNIIRYIIGDMKGIIHITNLIHGKLRTPKNKRFNDLIEFINAKYDLTIPESSLDNSNYLDNSWLTGFTEADGHFGIKYVDKKDKSETSKRSRSESISLKFRLDQRAYDKPTSTDMKPFMEKLALTLSCNLTTYKNKTGEVLSLYVSSVNNIKTIINYFDKYPLIGDKLNDYRKWKIVYAMILSKEHLSEEGRLKVKTLINKL